MRKVFKYVIENELVQLPKGFKAMSFQAQGRRDLCLWALVDPDAPKDTVHFRVVGTGHEVDPRWTYIGTAQQGAFVWHLFQT